MARRKKSQSDSERINRLGLADPRTGRERLGAMIGRAGATKTTKRQDRRWDDSPEKMARNIRESDAARKRAGISSSRPKKAAKKTTRRSR